MDGLLVVDKPVGPTSHDVVARIRWLLREKRVGHTGTLDPMASGVLALVLGRATRLARFMSCDEKAYDARIQLGVRTDTYDAEGRVIGETFAGPWPTPADVAGALDPFRGTFLQQPPAYSAKKIGGRRSYALARAQAHARTPVEAAPLPDAVAVTLSGCTVTRCDAGIVELSLTCSAGFYVRSLAHDLGERLGIGAHLVALRRTRSGAAKLSQAVTLADAEADLGPTLAAVVPMADMLPHLPAVTLTEAGVQRAGHGSMLGPNDLLQSTALAPPAPASAVGAGTAVRLLAEDGRLVAIGRRAPSPSTALHPTVVLT